jgi:hypothetical protein
MDGLGTWTRSTVVFRCHGAPLLHDRPASAAIDRCFASSCSLVPQLLGVHVALSPVQGVPFPEEKGHHTAAIASQNRRPGHAGGRLLPSRPALITTGWTAPDGTPKLCRSWSPPAGQRGRKRQRPSLHGRRRRRGRQLGSDVAVVRPDDPVAQVDLLADGTAEFEPLLAGPLHGVGRPRGGTRDLPSSSMRPCSSGGICQLGLSSRSSRKSPGSRRWSSPGSRRVATASWLHRRAGSACRRRGRAG